MACHKNHALRQNVGDDMRNTWSYKNSLWAKSVKWRLAHWELPLPPIGRARQGCLCCQG